MHTLNCPYHLYRAVYKNISPAEIDITALYGTAQFLIVKGYISGKIRP